MSRPFHIIEKELQEIDDDFNSGRMNAFGSLQNQDDIFKDVRRVGEMQTQRHAKNAGLMAPIKEEELIDRAGDVGSVDASIEALTRGMRQRESTIRGLTETLRQTARHLESINDNVQRLNAISGVSMM
eukprot:PhM_4_TR2791/c0_g1_i1/m.62962